MHTACDLIETAWRRARRETGTRMRLFEHIRTITAYHVFPSWQALMTTLITGLPPPAKARRQANRRHRAETQAQPTTRTNTEPRSNANRHNHKEHCWPGGRGLDSGGAIG